MESDKLTNIFEMLVERLTNIELQNDKMINHMKETCVKNGLLDKQLFGYPLDVKLIDGIQFAVNKPEYVLVAFPNQIYDKEALCLNLFKVDHVEKVKPILDDILTQPQRDRVFEYIKYVQATVDNEEIKELSCEELGIDSIYKNITEHILNHYFKKKNSKVIYVINNCEFPSFILKNVQDIDEIWSIVNDVLGFWNFTIKQRDVRDCMHVDSTPAYWVQFYIMLVGEDYDINWKSVFSKVTARQFDMFKSYVKRVRNGYQKTDNYLLTEDSLDVVEKRLKKMEQYVNK
jgi:hypothetical protein